MCQKRSYESKDLALKQMVVINTKIIGAKLKAAYKCPECNTWHLTTMNKHNSRNSGKYFNKIKNL